WSVSVTGPAGWPLLSFASAITSKPGAGLPESGSTIPTDTVQELPPAEWSPKWSTKSWMRPPEWARYTVSPSRSGHQLVVAVPLPVMGSDLDLRLGQPLVEPVVEQLLALVVLQ